MKIHDHELHRDDLTIPEKVSCIVLFFMCLIIFLYFVIRVVFIKLKLMKKTKEAKLTLIHYWVVLFIVLNLLARMACLSDALTLFFTRDPDYHIMPFKLDFVLNAISFMSMTELSTLFSLLW